MGQGFDDLKHTAWTVRLVSVETVRSFTANRGLQSAAMLAFYGFLSLMPLLLLLLFLFARILESSEQALAAVTSVTSDLLPTIGDQVFTDLMKLSGQHVWGVVSVVVLMWSMTPFASAVRDTLLDIFKLERRVGFLRAKLIDVAAVLGLLLLFVALVGARVWFNLGVASLPVVREIVPFVSSVLVLALFYAVFVPRGTSWSILFAGAAVTAVLLAVIRPLFGLLLVTNPQYGYAFGSLKAIFLLLIWVYYTFAAILFGAEVMANIQRREALLLRRLFQDGKRIPPTVARFARSLGPGEVLFREGDPGAEMFSIAEGSVVITKRGSVVREMKAGEYIGEMSMLLDQPRTADVAAGPQGARVLVIGRANFDTILRENPEIVKKVLKDMAGRLKATTERIQ